MDRRLFKLATKYKNYIILVLLVIGGILNDFTLRALTIGMKLYWKPVIANISIILIISTLTLFLSYKNRNYIFIVLSWVFSIINIVNYLYYKHFNSFLSLFIMNQIKQLRELKGSISNTIDFRILIFIIPNILLMLILRRLNNMGFFKEIEKPNARKLILTPLSIGILSLSIVAFTLTGTDFSHLVKQWNRPYLVENFGIYSYATADIVKNVLTPKQPSHLPKEEANNILEDIVAENQKGKKNNQYKDIFKNRDIYVIHYESAESFAIGEKLPGGYITPFLNRLASEGLYFSNFYPQHSVGTSSDSEFTFNTSLYPINDGTVFVTHSDREYLSLPKLLKRRGYYTMSMHGNNADFWNRDIMHNNLGYDTFISKEHYIIDEEIGLGLSDMSFFRQSVDKIKEIKAENNSPIMATLITLTNHFPFDDIDKYGEFDVGHMEDTNLGNYLKSYHYADRALESFVENMDREGLLDDAIIVLYGDHHANIPEEDYERYYNTTMDEVLAKELKRTPFIIWSKDGLLCETVDTPMGMIDALPTLANMIGVHNPYQLGVDMMSVDENTVIFPNASWLDNNTYYCAASCNYYDLDGEEVDETPELAAITETVANKLDISNTIVHNDLIRVFNRLIAKRH